MRVLECAVLALGLANLVLGDYSVPDPGPPKDDKGKASLPAHPDETGQTEGYYYPDYAYHGYYDTPTEGNEYYYVGDVAEVPLEYHNVGVTEAKPGVDYYADSQSSPSPAKPKEAPKPEAQPAPSYHHYPAPVYAPPPPSSSTPPPPPPPPPKKEEPKPEPKKEEPKKEAPKVDLEYEAKQKLYKADPFNYFEHDYLKPVHPKYWVKVSDYEPPKVKNPMNKWEKENLLKFTKDRIKTYLKLKDMVPIFKDWEEQENFEIGTFVDKVSILTVISIFVAAIGTIIPLWGFAVAQPPLAGRAFGGSRWAMMLEKARESFPAPPEGVDRLARTVAAAVSSHEQCGERFACELGHAVDSLPVPISRLARVATKLAKTMRPEFSEVLTAFDAGACYKFKCGNLSMAPPEHVTRRVSNKSRQRPRS